VDADRQGGQRTRRLKRLPAACRIRRLLAAALCLLLPEVAPSFADSAGRAGAAFPYRGNLELAVSCGLPAPDSVTTGLFEGREALRFRLSPDDGGQCPSDIVRGGYSRAELRSKPFALDTAVDIRFSVFVPADFSVTGPVFAGQFHQSGAPPLILLAITPDHYRVMVGSGLRALGVVVEQHEPLFDKTAFGRWQDIRLVGRFSRNAGGHVEVHANGIRKFRAIGATVRTQPYFKIGLYGRSNRIQAPLMIGIAGLRHETRTLPGVSQ
jgi:hypothetical protein